MKTKRQAGARLLLSKLTLWPNFHATSAHAAFANRARVAAAATVVIIRDERRTADALAHARGVARGTTAGSTGTAFTDAAGIPAAAAVVVVVQEVARVLARSHAPFL